MSKESTKKRSRFLWYSPLRVANLFALRWHKGEDEECNTSFGFQLPLLGILYYFYNKDFPRPEPCDECIEDWAPYLP